MYISNFQLTNYKSFSKSAQLELTPGFNLITGANNVGKTALLEGLSLRLSSVPHRSARIMLQAPDEISFADVSFVISNDEFWDILRTEQSRQLRSYLPTIDSEIGRSLGASEVNAEYAEQFWQWVFTRNEYRFDLRVRGVEEQHRRRWVCQEEKTCSLFSFPSSGLTSFCDFNPYEKTFNSHGAPVDAKDQISDLGCDLAQPLNRRVYMFEAERFALGKCKRETESELLPDAGNLANVLNHLQSNTARRQEYTELVQQVLPQIRQIGVRSYRDPTYVEVVVWTDGDARKDNELALSLSECGTGVGQVLAILYVVYTSKNPRTIIVDEPQSFLHPGAIRKLIDVLHRFTSHQLIFATHSPTVITASHASTIVLLTQNAGETSVRRLDTQGLEDQSLFLSEVGATLSDVFGADRILWVEGKTEEKCFPLLLNSSETDLLRGTAIVGVLSPSDLRGRHKQTIYRIYERLSSTTALIPPAIAFVFDRERLTTKEESDLKRLSHSKIHLLGRRMYENYLLHAEAIAQLINQLDRDRTKSLDQFEVAAALENASHNKAFFPRNHSPSADEDWRKAIDGAAVLEELFSKLSNNRTPYLKVVHGVALTQWLVENDSKSLAELVTLLIGILNSEESTPQ